MHCYCRKGAYMKRRGWIAVGLALGMLGTVDLNAQQPGTRAAAGQVSAPEWVGPEPGRPNTFGTGQVSYVVPAWDFEFFNTTEGATNATTGGSRYFTVP